MTLDMIDRRLLYELDQNARQSLAVIARKLRISRNVALYRFNKLKEQGIIKHSFAEINSVSLGYHSFRVFLKLGNFQKNQEEDLYCFVMKQKNLIWFAKVIGPWDVDLVFCTRHIHKFIEFKKEMFLKFSSIIEDCNVALLAAIFCYQKDYLIGKARNNAVPKIIGPGNCEIDDKDNELLTLLTKDAMTPLLELANKTKLSINTVKRKMKNLEKQKIILSYRLYLDTNKLGYHYYKIHLVLKNYSKSDVAALRQWLESKSFMIYTDHHVDNEDYEIELQLTDEKQYLEFIDEMNAHFGRIIKNHYLIKFYDERLFRYLPEED